MNASCSFVSNKIEVNLRERRDVENLCEVSGLNARNAGLAGRYAQALLVGLIPAVLQVSTSTYQ